MHRIKVHADTQDIVETAAHNANAQGYGTWVFGDRVVAIIFVDSLGQRQTLRHDPTIDILPNPNSIVDVSAHAAKMKLPNAKTARDIHAAVFNMLDLDDFDPDL